MDGARQELINMLVKLVEKLKAERREMRNDLCSLCGEHKYIDGDCDKCKWRDK